jgi:hypothetical protein
MSIKADVLELEAIRAELKRLNSTRRDLRRKEREVETRIETFLRSKDQPGVKHQGTAVILEETEKRLGKKSKDRDSDAKTVLQRHGISDTEKVLAEIMEARKGQKISIPKLKLKKYHNNNFG